VTGELAEKVAIITGAGQGIGRAIARRFVAEGARVVVAELDPRTGQATADALGGGAIFCPTDVTRMTDVQKMVDTALEAFGRVDVLVNNAGIFQRGLTQKLSEEMWQRVIDVDLTGAFLCCQAVGHVMIPQKSGRIVNISSINGLVAFPERLAYNCSKAGVIALTKALACEWATHNVTVNTVAPGYVRTEATDEHLAHGWFDEASILGRTPLGRWIEMDDVARAVFYLASDQAANVTGVVLPVDGGWVAYGYL
jgi:NAD(P)-dependent dehydrogenase (short-subunit alcohol dehydrogenase family)